MHSWMSIDITQLLQTTQLQSELEQRVKSTLQYETTNYVLHHIV